MRRRLAAVLCLAAGVSLTPAVPATAGVPFSQDVRLIKDGPSGTFYISTHTGYQVGKPVFAKSSYSYDMNVYRLIEEEKTWNYYFVDVDTTRKSSSGSTSVGYLTVKASTAKATSQSSYTKSVSSTKSECATVSAGISAGIGPLTAGTTVSKPVYCGKSAKATLSTADSGRVGTYKLAAPAQSKTGNFKKFIRVKAGNNPAFTVTISGPCHYTNPTRDLIKATCSTSETLSYKAHG